MKRLIYPDICKFIAIFLVTWSHCAQCIADQTWTNILGSTEIDIAFNMPLFMIISGWFINLDKLRTTTFRDYSLSKFKRLIIPSFVWFILHLIIINNKLILSFSNFCWYFNAWLNYYWYLTALFVCLMVIFAFSVFVKNNLLCIFLSTLFVLMFPFSYIANINFMFPFIWAGYGIRRLLDKKYAKPYIAICIIIGIALSTFWNHSFSVYETPFKLLQINSYMILIYLYRFTIGLSISSIIIYYIRCHENTKLIGLSTLGKYSLVIYTASIFILDIIKTFNLLHQHTNQFLIIDILSLFLCLFIIYIIIIFAKICHSQKLFSLLFMGESYEGDKK